MFPAWLHALSIAALVLGAGCALLVAVDVARRPQKMAVMNVVWPVTALFGTVLLVWFYRRFGREAARRGATSVQDEDAMPGRGQPFAAMVAKGALHCGAGCTIGDVLAEGLSFAAPGVATWLGWHTLFAQKMFAVWLLDFAFAFALGIVFQYLAIAPMRHLAFGKGLVAALKADTLSLAAWQVGMYGFMALAQFGWFASAYGAMAEVDTPEFWFAMQLAMLAGLATAFPVNWWLLRAGIKEPM